MNEIYRIIAPHFLKLRRTARRAESAVADTHQQLRAVRRSIRQAEKDRFGGHRKRQLERLADGIQHALDCQRDHLRTAQKLLMEAVTFLDSPGGGVDGDVRLLADLLGVDHRHIERAIADGCNPRLLDLALHHCETASDSGPMTTRRDCVVFHAAVKHIIEAIRQSPALEEAAMDCIQEIAMEGLGRPLVMHYPVTLPDGTTTLRPARPSLRVVR